MMLVGLGGHTRSGRRKSDWISHRNGSVEHHRCGSKGNIGTQEAGSAGLNDTQEAGRDKMEGSELT